jgi:hypothetical protein
MPQTNLYITNVICEVKKIQTYAYYFILPLFLNIRSFVSSF